MSLVRYLKRCYVHQLVINKALTVYFLGILTCTNPFHLSSSKECITDFLKSDLSMMKRGVVRCRQMAL